MRGHVVLFVRRRNSFFVSLSSHSYPSSILCVFPSAPRPGLDWELGLRHGPIAVAHRSVWTCVTSHAGSGPDHHRLEGTRSQSILHEILIRKVREKSILGIILLANVASAWIRSCRPSSPPPNPSPGFSNPGHEWCMSPRIQSLGGFCGLADAKGRRDMCTRVVYRSGATRTLTIASETSGSARPAGFSIDWNV